MKTIIVSGKSDLSQSATERVPVMIESPLAGDLANNIKYARLGLLNGILNHGEAPMAFHLLYTQSLCDATESERKLGIETSFKWHDDDLKKVFYIDRGFSQGMSLSYVHALEKGIQTEFRTMSKNEEIRSFINEANINGLDVSGILALRALLDDIEKGRPSSEGDGYLPGDKTGYTPNFAAEVSKLSKIERQNAITSELSVVYDRLCMRDSILAGNAPLMGGLMERQLRAVSGWLIPAWSSRANGIELYADLGVTDELKQFLLESVHPFQVSSLSKKDEIQREVREINLIEDPAGRLDRAGVVFGTEIEVAEKMIIDHEDNAILDRVNHKNYESKERAFSI